MKNIGTFVFTCIAGALLLNVTAYAYLDPGTGSILLQVLAGAALVIGVGWRFIVNGIKKAFKKNKEGQESEEQE